MTESAIVNDWIEKASNERVLQNTRGLLLKMLEKRFGRVPQEIAQTITEQPSRELLDDWFERAVDVPSLDEFRAYLRR
jgi:hypothetical protein